MKHKFGMFIHWGIYALSGWQEQYMLRNGLTRAEYCPLMNRFNPTEYDPDKWVALAKSAGMEYICFTAKHHDGFCMWDTKYTDFNIMYTPYGKDVLRGLADACERGGIALSIYYSLPDAHHPNGYNELSSHQLPPESGDVPDSVKYREYVKNQITELLTNYGKIYTLFWDIPPHISDPSINELARHLQPDILINDRGYSEGDFSTPERNVPDGERFTRPTEACESVGAQSWGWRTDEDYHTAKFIMQSMDKIMLMGGSYLLNVGPDELGRIPEHSRSILNRVGSWYKKVMESYDAEAFTGLTKLPGGTYVTRRGNTLYLHLTRDASVTGFSLEPLASLPDSAYVLNNSSPLKLEYAVLPSGYIGGKLSPRVPHIFDIPLDELTGEPVIIRMNFNNGIDLSAR